MFSAFLNQQFLNLESPKSNQFSVLEIQTFNIKRTFYDFSFLCYHGYLNPATWHKKNGVLKLFSPDFRLFKHNKQKKKNKKIENYCVNFILKALPAGLQGWVLGNICSDLSLLFIVQILSIKFYFRWHENDFSDLCKYMNLESKL